MPGRHGHVRDSVPASRERSLTAMKQLTPSRTRSRKHPLGLTLLSENYKQLLADFQDFQGAHRDNSDSDGNLSGLSTPPEQTVQPPSQQNSVQPLYSIINKPCRGSGSAKTPRTGAGLIDATQQNPAEGSAAHQGAAAKAAAVQSKGSKTPGSSKPSRSPSKKQKPCDDGSKQRHQPKLSPRQPSAAAAETAAGDTAAVQKAQTPQKGKQQHSTPKSKQPRLPGSKGTPTMQHGAGAASGATSNSTADVQGAQQAAVAAQSAAAAAATAASFVAHPAVQVQGGIGVPDKLQHPQQQQAPQVMAASAPQQQQQQQQQEQSQHKAKQSRRRVGMNSQPLTQNSSSSSSTAVAAAAGSKDTGHGLTKAAAFELPPLPLQRLHALGPVQLPPLHPTTARAGSNCGSSAKASRSEPASARISRRSSDTNTDEAAVGDTAGRRSDSCLPAASNPPTVRHHSLPEPAAVQASSRRHSIACLIEVSRKQQQARHRAETDGGLQPECADAAGVQQQQQQQQRPQQQQLQPLKQLLEMRRRGQLRAGGDDSSHDCQILVLDGPNPGATTYNLKQGVSTTTASSSSSTSGSSSQHTGLRQQGSAAATAAAGPQSATATAAGTSLVGHRRTRSSNTQLPPLDEHAVLVQSRIAGPAQAGLCGAPFSLPQMQAAAAAGDGLGLLPYDMEGLVGAGHISRRSSRADSDISSVSCADSTTGALMCEPSSFGVCADPAGAVHLVNPAIPDKLARLRQRLPSRLTADSIAAAAAAVPSGSNVADQLPGSSALQGSTQPQDGMLPQAAAQPPAAASKSGRIRRARWQLPAVNPQPAPDTTQQEQQQQQLPPPPPPPQQQQQQQHGGQHELPAAGSRSTSYRHVRGSAAGSDPGQHPLASSTAPFGVGSGAPPQQPQSWDGGTTAHQQYEAAAAAAAAAQQQQQQQGVNMTFMAELRRQLDHWAQWVHMHHTHPQQVPPPPQLPPQLATLAQQEQYQHLAQQQLLQHHHQQQQQLLHQQQQQLLQHQQQQGFPQQFLPQNPARMQAAAAAGGSAAAPTGALGGFVGPVPAHGALSRFTDPWAEKQQQRLLQHRQGVQVPGQGQGGTTDPAAAAVALNPVHPHVAQSGQEAGAGRQQQQQEAASSPVVSAAALAQQRRAMQQQAFEGLSLEAVLKTAQKTKPPSRKTLLKDGEGQAEMEPVV